MPGSRRTPSARNPHDVFAKLAFGQITEARGFFRAYLPPEVAALFDWRTLRRIKESFASDALKQDFADLRFSVCLASVTTPEQENEVRRALVSIPEEFGPIKENMITLLEHLQEEGRKEGVSETLVGLFRRRFPKFSKAHERRVQNASDELLEQLSDAIAEGRSWEDVQRLLTLKRNERR